MKKFLVFLISIVVVVSFGLVTYYFLRNDEVINFKANEIYCNVGDIITINDLGKSVKKASNKTKYNYNAASEEVVDAIAFNDNKGYYVAKKGGDFEVVISTSNKKFPEFKFTVHIGDGSETNPYFISSEQTLSRIGSVYGLDASYVLRADILLSADFKPIGYNSELASWVGFSGKFDGNNHTITGSNFAFDEENAGLFYSLNAASVKNLAIKSFNITGEYSNAGVLAGSANNVNISNVKVSNSSITSTKANTVIGGLIGTLVGNATMVTNSSVNEIVITSSDTASATVGGFAGKLNQGTIRACLATGSVTAANAVSKAAGFVGEMVVSNSYGTIQQSYSVVSSNFAEFASFVHTVSTTGVMSGANYLKFFIGNYTVTNGADAVKVKPALIENLYDQTKGIYGVVSYADLNSMLTDSSYVYYTINGQPEYWDSYIWKIVPGTLPTLYSTNLTPSAVSSEYFLSNNDKEFVYTTEAFMTFINECRTNDGKIKNKTYVLTTDIDLASYDWTAIDVENSIIDGNNHKILNVNLKNADAGNLAFFGRVNNSTIKNIKFENVKVSKDATNGAVVANIVEATDSSAGVSNIENISVNYESEITNSFTNFASIANQVKDGSIVKNCKVLNLTIAESARIATVAGVVNTVGKNSRVDGSVVTATIKAQSSAAGMVNTNKGSILNSIATISISHSDDATAANIAGLAVTNDGEITKATLALKINVTKSADNTNVAGAVVINNGNVSGVQLAGDGITTADTTSNILNIAGFVCNNNGKLSSSKTALTTIGSYHADKRHNVAGIAVNNSSNNSVISQVLVASNIEGNTVAGAVVKMNNAAAKIDQIAICGQNYNETILNQNTIKGDRFIAGVVVDLRKGSVSNVQASSQINGTKNSTVGSFIALIFPNGASFKSAAINSTFKGSGKFYSECWQDFRNAGEEVKNELDYHTTGNSDRSFDILDYDASAGSLQSVIINQTTANSGKSFQTATFISEGVFFGAYQWPSYEDTDRSSFFKFVNDADFNKISTYKGSISMSTSKGVFNWGSVTFTKQCDFNFDDIWSEVPNNGIKLQFLADI